MLSFIVSEPAGLFLGREFRLRWKLQKIMHVNKFHHSFVWE